MVEKKNLGAEATGTRATDTLGARTLEEGADIEPIITSVERVYQTLTGSTPPPPPEEAYAPIPVERDPGEYVSQRFETLLDALERPQLSRALSWSPPLTVWESDNELVLCVDLPGVRRDDVELTFEAAVLTVRGRRATDHNGARLRMIERPLGPFERRVLLPARVDSAQPTARLEDGVLEVRLGKRRADAASGRREIRVS
jgi:HSP20 family protein